MSNAIQFNREELKSLISKEFFLVILISIPSAIISEYFKIPLAWMLGPMIAISITALMGFKVKIPSNPENFLQIKYGKDWKTPKKKWNVVFDDGSIIR